MEDLKGLILAESHADEQLAESLHGRSRYLLPVANRMLVRYGIQALAACGIDEILIAVSPSSMEDVGELIGDGSRMGLKVRYLQRGEQNGARDTLLAAHELLGPGTLAVHAGDALVTDSLLPLLLEFGENETEVMLVTEPNGVALAQPTVGGRPFGGPGHYPELSWVDRSPPAAIFSSAAIEALRELDPSQTDGANLGGTVAALAEEGRSVTSRALQGCWSYSGRCDDLLEGNRMVLDQLTGETPEGALLEARIEGRVAIHPSASLVRTRVRGPAVIGEGAELIDSVVGPYSAIGPGVKLDGAEIEHSILMAGAEIRNVGRRIEASVIGEFAEVKHDFCLPIAARLHLGRRSSVALS